MRRLGPARLAASLPWLAAGAALGILLLLRRTPVELLVSSLFVLVLAKVSVTDLRERRIPNTYTLWGVVGALLFAASRGIEPALWSLLGIVGAGGVMVCAQVLSRGQLGMGDVKLSAFVGAALGVQAVPAYLVLSSLFGCAVAVYVFARTRDRRAAFAYGPCLAAAAALLLLVRGSVGA
jgi:leader peptidase (prepilin peptidase)/N-methyltransferase